MRICAVEVRLWNTRARGPLGVVQSTSFGCRPAPAGADRRDDRPDQDRSGLEQHEDDQVRDALGGMALPGMGAGRFCSQKGVATAAGINAWTLTPKLFTSSAIACESPTTPNFEAQ